MSAQPAELRPGLWRLPVSLEGHSVGHVNVYALLEREGVLLVDTGWGREGTWARLDELLAVAGARIHDVTGVLVTHVHADHCGLARELQRRAGAWVGMHRREAALVADRYEDATPYFQATERWVEEVGGPPEFAARARKQMENSVALAEPFDADVALDDGARVTHGRWELTALHTPGHTAGHACFHESGTGVLFSGDHVLPRIRVSPSFRPQAVADPVGDYLASLERLEALPVEGVLPGHQRPFLDFRSRAAVLRDYHHARLEEIHRIVERSPGTVWEVCAQVSRGRAWDHLRTGAKIAALGEAYAHLQHLRAAGSVECSDELPPRWSAAG